MSETITYDDALETYYSLKQRYEKKYNTMKAKIINDDDLTKKQKQTKVKAIKMPCISCSKKVGTIFEDKDRKLSAVCGSQTQPCKLNIQIKKSETMFTPKYKEILFEERQTLEYDIIRLKLSLLFGFIDEEELNEVFDDLKKKYQENKDLNDLFEKFDMESLNLEERKEQIKLLNIEKYNTIKDIKKMMSEFMATNNTSLLKDSVEMSIENLSEILEKLRENKYREMFIETQSMGDKGTKVTLLQNTNSIHDLEYDIVEGEVQDFVI